MEWYASQGMTSSTEQSSIFFWGELQLSEMGLNKVATGNWILESGERQKKIKISGTLRVVIVFRPWEFSANKKKKETKTSMSFFLSIVRCLLYSPMLRLVILLKIVANAVCCV